MGLLSFYESHFELYDEIQSQAIKSIEGMWDCKGVDGSMKGCSVDYFSWMRNPTDARMAMLVPNPQYNKYQYSSS